MSDLGIDRYELYRVITDMDALHEAFRDRFEDLQATREAIDEAGGFQSGYAGKLLCNPPMKSFGRQSLPRMLKAGQMALILVIDNECFAPVKERLEKRKRPMRSIVRIKRPKWLFNREKASKARKKYLQSIPEAKLAKKMRKLAKGRWIAHRRRERALAQLECVAEIA